MKTNLFFVSQTILRHLYCGHANFLANLKPVSLHLYTNLPLVSGTSRIAIILLAPLCSSQGSDLLAYLRESKVNINLDYHETHVPIFLQTVDTSVFATETFKSDIHHLINPGINPSPLITNQIKTIKSMYTDLQNLISRRNKYLDPLTDKPDKPCQISMQIFSNKFAKYIVDELSIIRKDLPDPNIDLSTDNQHSKRVSSLLMQCLIDLTKIFQNLNAEILELENYINLRSTPTTYIAAQSSPCLEPDFNEHITIQNTKATSSGLLVYLKIIQYKPTIHAYKLIPTPYFGYNLDLTHTYLIDGKLAKCDCIYENHELLTGCTCLPLNQNCDEAIISNDIFKIFNECPIVKTLIEGPRPTLTGILFPSFYAFTLENSSLDLLTPNTPSNFPFHIQSNKKFIITYMGKRLSYRATNAEIEDSMQTLPLSKPNLEKLQYILSPMSLSDIYKYISISLASLTGLIILPLFFCICVKRCNCKFSTFSNADKRRPINLTLNKLY